jgi:hypothetical protein
MEEKISEDEESVSSFKINTQGTRSAIEERERGLTSIATRV